MYVFAYLRLNIKRHDFVMRLPIKAQIRTSKDVQCLYMIKCVKVRHFLQKIKCVLHVENNYVSVQHSRQILLNPFQSVLHCIAIYWLLTCPAFEFSISC